MDIYCRTCGEPWEIDSLHNDSPDSAIAMHSEVFFNLLSDATYGSASLKAE